MISLTIYQSETFECHTTGRYIKYTAGTVSTDGNRRAQNGTVNG